MTDWPLTIRPAAAEPLFYPDPETLRSPFSGAGQKIVSPATLHGMRVVLPGMTEANARVALNWIAAGRRGEVRFPWFNLNARLAGNFVVTGVSGRTLTLDVSVADPRGFTAVGEGVQVVTGGRSYLHIIDAVTATTITLASIPRANYLGGFATLGAPLIQGEILSPAPVLDRVVTGFSFTIMELR